jgi:hypothetical protein
MTAADWSALLDSPNHYGVGDCPAPRPATMAVPGSRMARMDDLNLGKLEALVITMRRLGVLECAGVVLGPVPVPDPGASAEVSLDQLAATSLLPDDALFWSTSGPLPSESRDANRPPEE